MKNIVIFGAPGAGKGTQSEKMIAKYGLGHISTGDVLRNEIKKGSDLGKTAKGYIDKGQLIPDELMVSILAKVYDSFGKDHKGVIFDGFPRTIAQAEALDRMLAKNGEAVTSVVSIMIPDAMIKERIQHRAAIEGRADDAKEETINNRIKTYHEKTEPLVEFYKKAGKYEEIDGTGTIEEVRGRIFKNKATSPN